MNDMLPPGDKSVGRRGWRGQGLQPAACDSPRRYAGRNRCNVRVTVTTRLKREQLMEHDQGTGSGGQPPTPKPTPDHPTPTSDDPDGNEKSEQQAAHEATRETDDNPSN